MSDRSPIADSQTDVTPDLDFEQARLAYSIIQNLLAHTPAALIKTPHWEAYLESRRALERTRDDIEKFSAVMIKLSDDIPEKQSN